LNHQRELRLLLQLQLSFPRSILQAHIYAVEQTATTMTTTALPDNDPQLCQFIKSIPLLVRSFSTRINVEQKDRPKHVVNG
jgi:hypothetical protein